MFLEVHYNRSLLNVFSLSSFLLQKSAGKLAGQYVDLNDESGEPKRKKRVFHRAVKPTVGARFRGVDSENIQKVPLVSFAKDFCKLENNIII